MVSLFNLEFYKKYEKIILNPTAPYSIFKIRNFKMVGAFNLELYERKMKK